MQHALALEHGLSGWIALKAAVESSDDTLDERAAAIASPLEAAGTGNTSRVAQPLDEHPESSANEASCPDTPEYAPRSIILLVGMNSQ